MEKSECKRMALWWLAILRTDTLAYDEAIRGINEYLAAGGLTLADIGTTWEEIAVRRRRGLQLMAMYWLERLRRGSIMYKVYLQSVRNCLEAALLYPDDIGSCDRELESFEIEVEPAVFKKWLKAKLPPPFDYGVRF